MNATEERELLRVALRNDLATFIHRTFQTVARAQQYRANGHIEAMASYLERCARREIKRLLTTVPPRHLKSICSSVAFPAWVLGLDPSARIVCASYSAELASKHALDCRAVMESRWYQETFPATRLSRDKNKELDFMTTARGYRFSTSVGGTLTGRGGNIIIVDDPIKPEEAMSDVRRAAVNEWFDRTLYTRLDDKREDVIIVVMQRVHPEDLVGHILSKEEEWVHLSLPAIAEKEERVDLGRGRVYVRRAGEVLHEDREPIEVLERIKRELGTFNFSAQYQQCPIPPGGNLIRWLWFRFYNELPERGAEDRMIQSWDTASKANGFNDYSVCTTWLIKEGTYYLVDVLRKRLLYPDLRRAVIEQARVHAACTVIIEDKGSGTSLIQDLNYGEEAMPFDLIEFEPELDKATRMHAQSATIESGRVYLPAQAQWLEALRQEVLQFPNGRHDDQVDSVSQFLNWAEYDRTHVVGFIGWL